MLNHLTVLVSIKYKYPSLATYISMNNCYILLSRPSISPFFNGKNPFLGHGFRRENGIPEREMLHLSIYEINFWGNSNCKFWPLKTFTVLAWFTTFELAVVLMNTSENLDSIWNSGVNSPLFRQFKHQKWFHSGNFSKGKAISLCESELWTSWLQHFPYVRICLLLTYL